MRRAVKAGRLVRASECERCGAPAYTEAAHYNYVERLRVIWLCRPCHRSWDRRHPKTPEGDIPLVGQMRGVDAPNVKLTEAQVRFVLASSDNSGVLARQLCVHKSTIKDIRKRRTWAHISLEEVSP